MHALKCDFCGASLVMDKSREFATCEFCGTKYLKETIREKIQEIRGQVSVVGAVETVTGDAEKERLVKNAETYMSIKEFDKAVQTYIQITKQFPDDYRGWWGTYTAPIEKYFATGTFSEAEKNSLRNAFNLSADKSVFAEFFDSVISRYGNTLRTTICTQKVELVLAKIQTPPPMPDDFTQWLLFHQFMNTPYFTNQFNQFIVILSNQFVQRVREGSIFVKDDTFFIPAISQNMYIDVSESNLYMLVRLIAKLNGARHSSAPITNDPNSKLFHRIGWGNNYIEVTQVRGFCGRWIYANNKAGRPITVLSSSEITLTDLYKQKKVCQHCGGIFRGLVKPVCGQCGLPKDY